MLQETREITMSENAIILGDCSNPYVDWSNVTLECESEITFLGTTTEWPDNRPRRKL